jgi:predicted small secreted protein
MKFSLVAVALASTFALAACNLPQGEDDDEDSEQSESEDDD